MPRLKIPEPKKLPSGNWRVQFQIDGKRYSVTRDSKTQARDDADTLARDIFGGKKEEKKTPLTVGAAIDRYISEKEGTLSPSTIKGYKAIRRNYLQDLMDVPLKELTTGDIQSAVSADAVKGKSPKTIRNAHGLLAAVLDEFQPDMNLKTRLPQKKKYEIRIFTEEEMKKVWNAAKGSVYELPILLASWMGLRMSEIRGIKYCDIQDDRIHIQRAVVRGAEGHVEKATKTTSGDRWIKPPKTILNMIERQDHKSDKDYICPYADITIYKNFIKICEKAGVEPCRFHDLRHFAASEMHAIGIPDKYSMARMGHKTDNMLKTVYQHTMRDKEDAFATKIDRKMEKLYKSAHKNARDKQNSQ